ncbi:IPT/TIG domain-containing protein [Nonomuraea sp. NPDC003707]
MPINIPRVQPGDLIRADFVNRLIAGLEELDARLTAVELGGGGGGGNAPVITGRFPIGDITRGSELRLLGRNFLIPANDNKVEIDGVSVGDLQFGSNENMLIFVVPPNLTSVPKDAVVTVTNRNGSARTTVRIIP